MLGADFTAQFETNWIPGTGWADEGVGLDFQPAVPNLLAGDQETGRFDDVADYLTRTGGPNELRNVARMTYRMGQSVGFPRGQFASGVQALFSRQAAPSLTLPAVPSRQDLNLGNFDVNDYLKLAWGVIENTGMGASWRSFAQVAGSKVDKITGNLPVVAVVASIVKIWARAIRGRIGSIGEPNWSSAPDVSAWAQRSGITEWNRESDERDANEISSAIRSGVDLTGLISPRASTAATTTVGSSDATAAFYAGIGDPDAPGGTLDIVDFSRLGYAPGTDAIIRGFQNPSWDGEWLATGQFAVTGRALCSQAWQLASAGHPSLGAYNLTLAKNRWRSYFRYLAWQILRGGRWIGNPLPPIVGGFGDWTAHTDTLRSLWNSISAVSGWPDLDSMIIQTRSSLNLKSGPLDNKLIGQWAYEGARAIVRDQPSTQRFQGIIEMRNTPVRTIDTAQKRQRELFKEKNPLLLPYAPVDADLRPIWPGVAMSAANRANLLTELVNSSSVCDVDPLNVPKSADSAELIAAILAKQSECGPRLAAKPMQATPIDPENPIASTGTGLSPFLIGAAGLAGALWLRGRAAR